MLQPHRHDPPADPIDAWTQIRALILQPPRLSYADHETGDYHADRRRYETEKKQISRARSAALAVLDQAIGQPYNRAALAYACAHSYSGRLTWTSTGEIDYCAGQQPGTERRYAALAVLRSYMDMITGPRYTIGKDGRIYSQPQG